VASAAAATACSSAASPLYRFVASAYIFSFN
jgi:hypothetical protein